MALVYSMRSLALTTALAVGMPLPAQAGWFDDAMGAISGMFGGGSADLGGMTNMGGNIDGRADIEAQRAAAVSAAGAVGWVPALLGAQILQQAELHIATDLQWRMVEALESNDAPAATAAAESVRGNLGTQGVAWAPGSALEQHREAYVQPMGQGVRSQADVRDRISRMISLKTAAGKELAMALASQAEAGDQDSGTMREMLDSVMAAAGPTQALQGLAQLNALLIEKFGQQQATNAAFQKFVLAQSASDEFERNIAFTQRDRDARDMLFGESFGIPDNEALEGHNSAMALTSSLPDPLDQPFVGPGM
jgi:hypothetical protein